VERLRKPGILVAVGALLVALPFVVGQSEFYLNVIITAGIFLIMAISFRFLHDLSLLNLGHPVYMGIGAYISAVLTVKLGLSFWVALPLAGLAPALFALVIGFPTLRIGMVPFFMISLSLMFLFPVVLGNYGGDIFGGHDGLAGVPPPTIGNLVLSHGITYYYLILAVVLLTVLLFWHLDRSRFGKLARAIGSSQATAESVGVNTFAIKIMAFMLCTFFAGIAGSLYAHYIGIVSPNDFGIQPLILMQVYTIVGGISSFFGPLIGATVMGALSIPLMNLQELGDLVFGMILVLVLLFSPDGLMGIWKRIIARRRRLQLDVESDHNT
jgi:branched-chain amino acid transport system permease protein